MCEDGFPSNGWIARVWWIQPPPWQKGHVPTKTLGTIACPPSDLTCSEELPFRWAGFSTRDPPQPPDLASRLTDSPSPTFLCRGESYCRGLGSLLEVALRRAARQPRLLPRRNSGAGSRGAEGKSCCRRRRGGRSRRVEENWGTSLYLQPPLERRSSLRRKTLGQEERSGARGKGSKLQRCGDKPASHERAAQEGVAGRQNQVT